MNDPEMHKHVRHQTPPLTTHRGGAKIGTKGQRLRARGLPPRHSSRTHNNEYKDIESDQSCSDKLPKRISSIGCSGILDALRTRNRYGAKVSVESPAAYGTLLRRHWRPREKDPTPIVRNSLYVVKNSSITRSTQRAGSRRLLSDYSRSPELIRILKL